MNLVIIFIVSLILFICIIFARKAYQRGLHIWGPTYIKDHFKVKKKMDLKSNEPIHIMLCLVDHFEPGNGKVDLNRAKGRVNTWVNRYPALAEKHRDSDNKPPQHTWFFPPHYHQADHLARVS